MSCLKVLLGSLLICAVTSSNVTVRAPVAPRRIGPGNLAWKNQLNASGTKLVIDSGDKNVKVYDMGFEKPIVSPKSCTLPSGLMGKCRSLQYCPREQFLKSFRTFMLHHCIDGESIGVCCGNGPIRTEMKGPAPATPAAASAARPAMRPLQPTTQTPQVPTKINKVVPSSPSKVVAVAPSATMKPAPSASPLTKRPAVVQKVPAQVATNDKVVNIFIVLPEKSTAVRVNVTKQTSP